MLFKIILFLLSACVWGEWKPLVSGTTSTLNSVHFFSEDTGFVCGTMGTLLGTTDRGATWTRMETGSKDASLGHVLFLNSKVGVVLGAGPAVRTENGGKSWSPIFPDQKITYVCLAGNGAGKIFMASREVGIMVSTDSGKNWNISKAPENTFPTPSLFAFIQFPTPLVGFAVTEDMILSTNDSGSSWSIVNSNKSPQFPSASFLNSGFFFSSMEGVVGASYYSGIHRTKDAAHSFTRVSGLPSYSLFFQNADSGYSGSSGKLLKTTDRGVTWNVDTDLQRPEVKVRKIFFPTPRVGFAVGDSGIILRYQGPEGTLIRPESRKHTFQNASGNSSRTNLGFDSLGKRSGRKSKSGKVLFHPL